MYKRQVQDSGSGFSEIVRDNLFSPFLTTKKGGMGMGLSISRSIIESHGGHLWVDFNDPVMTTFHFTLPVSNECVHNDASVRMEPGSAARLQAS